MMSLHRVTKFLSKSCQLLGAALFAMLLAALPAAAQTMPPSFLNGIWKKDYSDCPADIDQNIAGFQNFNLSGNSLQWNFGDAYPGNAYSDTWTIDPNAREFGSAAFGISRRGDAIYIRLWDGGSSCKFTRASGSSKPAPTYSTSNSSSLTPSFLNGIWKKDYSDCPADIDQNIAGFQNFNLSGNSLQWNFGDAYPGNAYSDTWTVDPNAREFGSAAFGISRRGDAIYIRLWDGGSSCKFTRASGSSTPAPTYSTSNSAALTPSFLNGIWKKDLSDCPTDINNNVGGFQNFNLSGNSLEWKFGDSYPGTAYSDVWTVDPNAREFGSAAFGISRRGDAIYIRLWSGGSSCRFIRASGPSSSSGSTGGSALTPSFMNGIWTKDSSDCPSDINQTLGAYQSFKLTGNSLRWDFGDTYPGNEYSDVWTVDPNAREFGSAAFGISRRGDALYIRMWSGGSSCKFVRAKR